MNTDHIHADTVIVDDDEGRFCLIVYTDDGDRLQIDIHDDILKFYANVKAEIGPWAHEANSARRAVAAGVSREEYLTPEPVTSRPVSVEDAIEAGYALDDPKSPGYYERMVD